MALDKSLERANRRMIEMLERIGMFPLGELPSPEELGKRVPLALDELATVCITLRGPVVC